MDNVIWEDHMREASDKDLNNINREAKKTMKRYAIIDRLEDCTFDEYEENIEEKYLEGAQISDGEAMGILSCEHVFTDIRFDNPYSVKVYGVTKEASEYFACEADRGYDAEEQSYWFKVYPGDSYNGKEICLYYVADYWTSLKYPKKHPENLRQELKREWKNPKFFTLWEQEGDFDEDDIWRTTGRRRLLAFIPYNKTACAFSKNGGISKVKKTNSDGVSYVPTISPAAPIISPRM